MENWEAGAEWRDWFITGARVEQTLASDGTHLIDPVNTHLQQLHQRSESSVYTALVSQPLRFNGESKLSLAEQVSDVSRARSKSETCNVTFLYCLGRFSLVRNARE